MEEFETVFTDLGMSFCGWLMVENIATTLVMHWVQHLWWPVSPYLHISCWRIVPKAHHLQHRLA